MACAGGARRRSARRPRAGWHARAARTRRGLGRVALVLVHGGYGRVQVSERVVLDMLGRRGGGWLIMSTVGVAAMPRHGGMQHKGRVQGISEGRHRLWSMLEID